jgi:hypothetical protein
MQMRLPGGILSENRSRIAARKPSACPLVVINKL